MVSPSDSAKPPERDTELLQRFLKGDTSAVRAVEGWVRGVVRFKGYRIPRQEQEEIVQQAVTSLWRAVRQEGFALHTALQAFVGKVALARCVDWIRRRRSVVGLSESLPDPGPAPDQIVIQEDEAAGVLQALKRLDASCQQLIRLHFFEELPYREIALRLGKAEATMRVRMFHCMKQLRQQLAQASTK